MLQSVLLPVFSWIFLIAHMGNHNEARLVPHYILRVINGPNIDGTSVAAKLTAKATDGR
jgi:hypothetical protein